MIGTKKKPPSTRRRFEDTWSELDYLCTKVRFWLYVRKSFPHARRYLRRLTRVLARVPENDEAILRHEGYALMHELRGDVDASIASRQREIFLMERLQREAAQCSASTRSYMLRDRDQAALDERRAILASLKARRDFGGNHLNGR